MTKLFSLRDKTGKSRAEVIGEVYKKYDLLLPITKLTKYEETGDMPYSVAVIMADYYKVELQNVVDMQVAD